MVGQDDAPARTLSCLLVAARKVYGNVHGRTPAGQALSWTWFSVVRGCAAVIAWG